MPKLRAPANDEARALREKGIDPQKILIDYDTGDLYDAAQAPAPTTSEKLTSALRSVTGGFASAVPQLTSIAGAGVESLGGGRWLSDRADEMENWLARETPADPRVSNWLNVPGQVTGQIGSMITGTGILGALAKARGIALTPQLITKLTSLAGAGMTAGDTASEELAKQERLGEDRSALTALAKGVGVGAMSVS